VVAISVMRSFVEYAGHLILTPKGLKVRFPCTGTVNYFLHDRVYKLVLGHTQMICAAEQVGYMLTHLTCVPKTSGWKLGLGTD